MARADYRLCDLCDSNAFYDSNLNYEWEPVFEGQTDLGGGLYLDYLGDWKVLCSGCAKTHECKIVPKEHRSDGE